MRTVECWVELSDEQTAGHLVAWTGGRSAALWGGRWAEATAEWLAGGSVSHLVVKLVTNWAGQMVWKTAAQWVYPSVER